MQLARPSGQLCSHSPASNATVSCKNRSSTRATDAVSDLSGRSTDSRAFDFSHNSSHCPSYDSPNAPSIINPHASSDSHAEPHASWLSHNASLCWSANWRQLYQIAKAATFALSLYRAIDCPYFSADGAPIDDPQPFADFASAHICTSVCDANSKPFTDSDACSQFQLEKLKWGC